jgi:hypothetical protein
LRLPPATEVGLRTPWTREQFAGFTPVLHDITNVFVFCFMVDRDLGGGPFQSRRFRPCTAARSSTLKRLRHRFRLNGLRKYRAAARSHPRPASILPLPRRLPDLAVEHSIEQNALHDRAQSVRTGPVLDRLTADGAERLLGRGSIISSRTVDGTFLTSAFFGSTTMRLSVGSSRSSRGGERRQAPNELGDKAVTSKLARNSRADHRCLLTASAQGGVAACETCLRLPRTLGATCCRRKSFSAPIPGRCLYIQALSTACDGHAHSRPS